MRKRRGKCAPASVEMERGSWSCAQTTESPVEKGLIAKPRDSFRGLGVHLSHYAAQILIVFFFIYGVGFRKSAEPICG